MTKYNSHNILLKIKEHTVIKASKIKLAPVQKVTKTSVLKWNYELKSISPSITNVHTHIYCVAVQSFQLDTLI